MAAIRGSYKKPPWPAGREETGGGRRFKPASGLHPRTEARKEIRPFSFMFALYLRFQAVYKDEIEAYECFCTYAHDNGFSVRKNHHSFWPNSRKIKLKDFVCSKAGFKKSDDHNSGKGKRFTRPVVRTGCPAMVRFVTDEDGYWHVKRFIESHNHELASPADRHLLRSCRNIIEEKASVLKLMTDVGIKTVDAYAYLAEEVGGCENIGFSKRDAYNFIQKEKRARIEIGDTNPLIQLFKDRQVEDHMFAWDVQYEDQDRLLNFFWVDGRSMIDYECFGDVLIFILVTG
ncbi:protein FAR1-RELATED SEQUENCE 5-like [Dendrobium catenatum]|uniref:protein FAR1-RELATED SEQUENCE 5-like n=1 Tax=Dendrobium catenatum TaxID=906689 RepID=UPI0010A05C90|nr:protein FAR1-RELATED SEQUENCE 5-like [Dendrobium catenatum]